MPGNTKDDWPTQVPQSDQRVVEKDRHNTVMSELIRGRNSDPNAYFGILGEPMKI